MPSILEELREKIFSKFQKDTWEIKTIEEIATDIYKGNDVHRVQIGTGDYPAITAANINGKKRISIEKASYFINPDLIQRKKYCDFGDILITNIGDKKTVGNAVAYLSKDNCIVGENAYVIKHNQNPKFLAYALSSEFSRRQIENSVYEGIVYVLSQKDIKKIKIPLPSLEIQQKIVEFLDKYIELERELERELEMRKKQYEFYKELLFKRGIEEQKWKFKNLEEIADDIYSGTDVTKEQLNTGDFPAIKYIGKQTPMVIEDTEFVDLNLIKKPKYCEKGDILFCKFNQIKETVGRASLYLKNEKCLVGGAVVNLKHNQNPKFLTYFFSTSFYKEQMEHLVKPGVIFQIYANTVKQINVPLPTLEEQTRLVEDLDKLYKITNDFKGGIPFLIRKNKEQYEFYRELLLER